MKYQEAFHKIRKSRGEPTEERLPNECELVQELVDKATPKKVTTFEYQGDLYFVCNKCDLVEKILAIDFTNYCPNCGQAMDCISDD